VKLLLFLIVCHLNGKRVEPIGAARNPWCREHLKVKFLVFTNAADSFAEGEVVRHIVGAHPDEDVRLIVSAAWVKKCLTLDQMLAQNVQKVAVEPRLMWVTAGNIRKAQANEPWVASRCTGPVDIMAPALGTILYGDGSLLDSTCDVLLELVKISDILLTIRDRRHGAGVFKDTKISG
jgi:hypothetical protein